MKSTGTNSDGGGDNQIRETKKAKADATIPDDVLLNIFSLVPTRTVVRCAALSRRHRQLVGDLDFWLRRRRRHGPPLHVAYMATASITAGCMFHDFHMALAGSSRDFDEGERNHDLRRALVDREQPYTGYHKYVGTCNGVVLLARGRFYGDTSTVLLFNPAVAGSEEEVDIKLPLPPPGRSQYRVAGFGYDPSSRRHKLLVTRDQEVDLGVSSRPRYVYKTKEILVCTLGGGDQRPRTLLSGLNAKISNKSVYLDGKVYLLADYSKVLAFYADYEIITTIDLPGERVANGSRHARSKLMEMSGRLCVATVTDHAKFVVWLLRPDQRWELRFDSWHLAGQKKLVGCWDCGGGAVLVLSHNFGNELRVHLYDPRTERFHELHIPRAVVIKPEKADKSTRLAFCWGYQPTLVSPGSIVGAPPRQRGGDGLAAALSPMLEQDVKTGKEQTLRAVCFVDMLLYIMRQLPDRASDVTKEFNVRSLPFILH